MLTFRDKDHGFTLMEILIVVVVLGILAVITFGSIIPSARSRAYYTRAYAEVNVLADATKLYIDKYNDYPPDGASRDIPNGIQEFLTKQDTSPNWPKAPWPNSVYDYDRWTDPADSTKEIVQISIRFCNAGEADATCKAKLPNEKFINRSTWDAYSSLYWCIKGACRSHVDKPINWPGYCMNCSNVVKPY